jgi:two-component system OmpR family response regulator
MTVTISRMTTYAARGQYAERPGGPARVLVVDDEPSLTDLLATALGYEGWSVRSAGDGWSAVRAARDFRPDVVVLDVLLPDLDGLQVMHQLRSEAPGLPVLLLTARDALEDRIRGLEAGGNDYVTKPFSLADVVDRLQALMTRPGGPF